MDRTARAHILNARMSPQLMQSATRRAPSATGQALVALVHQVASWLDQGYVDATDIGDFKAAVQGMDVSQLSGDDAATLRRILDSYEESEHLTATANGEYSPTGAAWFDGATVQVPMPELEELTATENGTYSPTAYGFSRVTVQTLAYTHVEFSTTHDASYVTIETEAA